MSSALSSRKFSEIIKRRLYIYIYILLIAIVLSLLIIRSSKEFRKVSSNVTSGGKPVYISCGTRSCNENVSRFLQRYYNLARRNFGESDVIFLGIYELSGCSDPQGLVVLPPYHRPPSSSIPFTWGSLSRNAALPVSDVP